MRFRPLVALSTVAAATLLLAGCAGGNGEASPSESTPTVATDLCAAAAPEGASAEAVTVTGEFGAMPAVEFAMPLEIDERARTIVTQGDGDAIAEGDMVSYALAIFDAETGEELDAGGYDEPLLPVPIALGSGADEYFGCAEVGSRVVMTVPGAEESPATVWVLDVLDVVPTAAWGEDQDVVEGMPVVELAEDGTPSVTIPEGDAPDEVELAVLKKGDGPVVEPGDNVMVQYMGIKWSDGSEFDSSWSRGSATSFPTTGVVDGFRMALEGQTVGSQVLVVIPPAYGYGVAGNEGHDLYEETLVFVVDVLATQ